MTKDRRLGANITDVAQEPWTEPNAAEEISVAFPRDAVRRCRRVERPRLLGDSSFGDVLEILRVNHRVDRRFLVQLQFRCGRWRWSRPFLRNGALVHASFQFRWVKIYCEHRRCMDGGVRGRCVLAGMLPYDYSFESAAIRLAVLGECPLTLATTGVIRRKIGQVPDIAIHYDPAIFLFVMLRYLLNGE